MYGINKKTLIYHYVIYCYTLSGAYP